jgi:hypothetical protein
MPVVARPLPPALLLLLLLLLLLPLPPLLLPLPPPPLLLLPHKEIGRCTQAASATPCTQVHVYGIHLVHAPYLSRNTN